MLVIQTKTKRVIQTNKQIQNSQVLPQCTQTLSEMDEELVMSDRPSEVMETSSAKQVVISLKFQASLATQAKLRNGCVKM